MVRAGELPVGGDEAVAEAGGRALLIGDGVTAAAAALAGIATELKVCDQAAFAPGAWATALAPLLAGEDVVIIPAGPDGRDLAPRLAHALDRPLLTGAVKIRRDGAIVGRQSGRVMDDLRVGEPFVATLQPGVRGVEAAPGPEATIEKFDLAMPGTSVTDSRPIGSGRTDLAVLEVQPADPATMDLSEAPRIIGGGAGLGSREAMDRLGELSTILGTSFGATRVVTDWGWLPFERQIGTTGVMVHPHLYLAFGISGAVQHVSGLGDPDHIISVNTDPSCPMMTIADLAIVADASAVVEQLRARLGLEDTDHD